MSRLDDMNLPVLVVILSLVLGVFIAMVRGDDVDGTGAHTDGTGMPVPYGDDCPYAGVDLTDLLYEAYAVYDVDMVRWREIAREMWRVVGAPVRYHGVYAHQGRWVIVSERVNGYYLQTGRDWTRGADGQLHGVLCAVLVDEMPFGDIGS